VVLGPALVQALKLTPTPDEFDDDDKNLLFLDSLTLGAAQFRKVVAETYDDDLPGMDGLLGLDAYYDVLMTVEGPTHRLRFTRGTLPEANGRDVIELHPIAGQLYTIESMVGHMPMRALFDTQNLGGFLFDPAYSATMQLVSPPIETDSIGWPGINNQLYISKRTRLNGDIQLGPVTFQRPFIDISAQAGLIDSSAVNNFGWEVLQHFTWTLDQRSRRVRLSSSQDVIPPPPAYGKFGFSTDRKNVVNEIVPWAQRQGLRMGDQVLSVNGIPHSKASHDTSAASPYRGIAPIQLVIRRGKTTKRIRLTKQIILP